MNTRPVSPTFSFLNNSWPSPSFVQSSEGYWGVTFLRLFLAKRVAFPDCVHHLEEVFPRRPFQTLTSLLARPLRFLKNQNFRFGKHVWIFDRMAADVQQSHRPGALKQQNKSHKHGKHKSKGQLDKETKGETNYDQLYGIWQRLPEFPQCDKIFLYFIFCRESQCKDSNEKKQVSAEETRQKTPRKIFQRFDSYNSLHD